MQLAHRLVSTRAGTLALAALAALAAGVAVFAYVHDYRANVNASGAPASVLVAEHSIPKGMAGDVAVSKGFLRPETLRTGQLADGAVVNSTAIVGKVATRDILPGEQVTSADFAATAHGLATRLTGSERAVSVELDPQHALAGQVQTGDHVDVMASFDGNAGSGRTTGAFVKVLFQDVPVLAITAPSSSNGNESSKDVLLQLTTDQAAKVAYAVENGKVWLVLRPRVGATGASASTATLGSLLPGAVSR